MCQMGQFTIGSISCKDSHGIVYHPKSVRQMRSALSDSFFIMNGVRQEGILSPLLFNVYMDDLSSSLSNTWPSLLQSLTSNPLSLMRWPCATPSQE